MNSPSTVGLVDDQPGMLRALSRLLQGRGYTVRTFQSAMDFLAQHAREPLDCVVLDVFMPELDGLEVQTRLNRIGTHLPIIFLTGHGDIPGSVRAMKAGAVDFLIKPVDESELLAAVAAAVELGRRGRAEHAALADLRARSDRLTPREMEVWQHVVTGKLNKQIAADLGVAEQTIKVHRMRITEKLGLVSVAELVRAAHSLGIVKAGVAS